VGRGGIGKGGLDVVCGRRGQMCIRPSRAGGREGRGGVGGEGGENERGGGGGCA